MSAASGFAIHADVMLQSLYERGCFNGTVLYYEQGKPLFHRSYGLANVDEGLLLHDQSVFELASVTKPFTALAVLQLAAAGVLGLEDEVHSWLGKWPYKGMHIRHLLSHCSGLPDYMTWFEQHWDAERIAYNEDVLSYLEREQPELDFAPGTQFSYSNTAYVCLAEIVAAASGMRFSDYIQRHIFAKVNLTHTQISNRRATGRPVDNLAWGYMRTASGMQLPDACSELNFVYYLDGIQGDGMMHASAMDLLALDRALTAGQLLLPDYQSLMETPALLNDGTSLPCGLGWFIDTDDARLGKKVKHGGGWPGYQTILCRYVDRDACLIVLSNVESMEQGDDQPSISQITTRLEDYMDRQ